MTKQQALDWASAVRPNSLPRELLLHFLEELEGRILLEIHQKSPKATSTSGAPYQLNPKLSVPSPYDRLYWSYLVAMIDLTMGDMQAYATSRPLFDEAFAAYARYYQRTKGE